MDFDPRDYTDERDARGRDWDDRERDDDDTLTIGRGSSSHSVGEHHQSLHHNAADLISRCAHSCAVTRAAAR